MPEQWQQLASALWKKVWKHHWMRSRAQADHQIACFRLAGNHTGQIVGIIHAHHGPVPPVQQSLRQRVAVDTGDWRFACLVDRGYDHQVGIVETGAEFVEQKKLNGIADAVLQVKTYVPDRFIVALGDCLYKGKFQAHNQQLQCIGVYKTNNVTEIKLNYSIELNNDNNVCKVLEKPTHIVNNLCGMGIYLFHRRVFKYIKKTKPSTLRNEIEITDVIQNMINAGELITPAFFNGHYVNITYPEDIQKAERLFI